MKLLRTSLTALLVLSLAAGLAQAQVATVLLREGDPVPGGPAGEIITSLNNPAVNHAGGYVFNLNIQDAAGATIGMFWGDATGGPGAEIRREATLGVIEQYSYESFCGFDDLGLPAYSPMCNNLDTGSTSLDAVFHGDTLIMIEEMPYPHLTGWFWSFGSRPCATADGTVFWVGGITATQGGSTANRGLFRGTTGTPIIVGGDMIAGLPDPLSTASTISFDYRVSRYGTHWIGEVATTTGSSLNDNHVAMDGAVVMAGGSPISEGTAIPASVGGIGGEAWDNFDYMGVTETGHYMFTGDTDGSTVSDEIVVKDGNIVYREGFSLGGEVVEGAIEGAYMNENGDVAFIWDVRSGTVEALFFEDILLLAEGDPVDMDGDMVPDPGTAITDFTGISTLTMTDRSLGDGHVDLYFTVDVEFTPLAGTPADEVALKPDPEDGLAPEDLADVDPGDPTPSRAVLECGVRLTVPAVVPAFLADFSARPQVDGVDIAWSVTGDVGGEFRLSGRQGEVVWEVPHVARGAGRYTAHDPLIEAADGNVVYALSHRTGDGAWQELGRETIRVEVPRLGTRILGARPNPFNPQSWIAFHLDAPARARVSVYDAGGRLVKVLAEEVFGAGEQTVRWDGRDAAGREVSSGTYLAVLEAGLVRDAVKVMLVR